MSFPLSYLRSLLLTILMSFLAPVTLVGGTIALLLLLGLLPGLSSFSQAIAGQILSFLGTFGNGSPWEGATVIGCACGLVGALFDTYIFYRFSSFRKS